MKRSLKRRIQEHFTYKGFGFPVLLVRVPMVWARSCWTPDVDFNSLSDRLLQTVARKPSRLTGAEIRFIRHSFSMTLQEFSRRFGVTHPAVLKWERSGGRATVMSWAVEKDIRLEILRTISRAKPSQFLEAYGELSKVPAKRHERIRIDVLQPA